MPFKTASGKLFYRIGDVIISTNSENPSKMYGGTWQLLCPGRTLVCIDTSDTDFNTAKKLGGSKSLQTHTHSSSIDSQGNHSHTGSALTSGSHNHIMAYSYKYNQGNTGYDFVKGSTGTAMGRNSTYTTENDGEHTHQISLNSTGNHSHNISILNSGNGNSQNLQPYIVVYMWVRVE